MTGVTLYHSTRCPYSRRVRFVLEALRVPYADVEIDLEAPPAWFEKVSPGATVPCLVHGDVDLIESQVIAEYLDEAFGGDLMPQDAADRAHARYVMQWVDDEWMGAVLEAMAAAGGGTDPTTWHRLDLARRSDLRRPLEGLEDRFVGAGSFLVGRDLSLADIAVSSTLPFLSEAAVDPRRHPRTAALRAALRAHPAWQAVPTRPQGRVLRRATA